MRFEWDAEKAASNRAKHGLDFRDAIPAVMDPRRLERLDTRFAYTEERWQIIGLSPAGILFVVTVETTDDYDEQICRIISARKASRNEQDAYFRGR